MASPADAHRWVSGAPPRVTPVIRDVGRALLMFPGQYRYCTEIAKSIGYNSGSVSLMLRKFESAGWVERVPYYKDPDKPSRIYYLMTNEGEEMLGALVWSEK